MAITDYIPVVLFTVSSIILQRYLYGRMSKGAFALFAAGTIMICVAGYFKATWKLLYYLNICDFEKLNHCFFPMQATGFLLAGIAMVAMTCHTQGKESLEAHAAVPALLTAPAVYSGTMIFVMAMVFGTIAMNTGLSIQAKKQHNPLAIVMFVLSAVCLLAMGYLSSKDFSKASLNWIAEGINFLGQAMFLTGAILISKK